MTHFFSPRKYGVHHSIWRAAKYVVAPFDKAVDSRGIWPRWRTVEVDLDYHFRRQVLPAPGSEAQLMSALGHFCAATLDRNVPLWECLLIDGVAERRFVIAFKLHHALVDGQGGLKILLRSLVTGARDKSVRALWGDNKPMASAKRSRRKKSSTVESASALSFATLKQLMTRDWLQQIRDMQLFRAPPSALNHRLESSARRFGIGDLPLEKVRQCARQTGVSINDVLFCVVDAAVHRYLLESGDGPTTELVAGMPVSLRAEGAEGGNQAGLLTIDLGGPELSEASRLEVIAANTGRAKTYLKELPAGFLMGYSIAVLGMPLLLQ